jgi:hypothetical protein
MHRALKIAEEEKILISLKNHELDRLYHELRETIALKEKITKKIKDHVIFKKFLNIVLKFFYGLSIRKAFVAVRHWCMKFSIR